MSLCLSHRLTTLSRDLSHGTERFPIRVINDVDDDYPARFTYSTRVVDRTGILKQRKTDQMLVNKQQEKAYNQKFRFAIAAQAVNWIASAAVESTMKMVELVWTCWRLLS